jgi:SAM-dependent methyltransferase
MLSGVQQNGKTQLLRIADIYNQTRWLTESVAEEVADFIVELVNASPETSFLEPGVGTGLNVLPLVRWGYAVTGIDVSQEMLDQFRQKLHEVPQNLTLIHADASRLPFPDQSFDVVLTVHMVHTVSNWKTFLDEIDRDKGASVGRFSSERLRQRGFGLILIGRSKIQRIPDTDEVVCVYSQIVLDFLLQREPFSKTQND